MSRVEVTLTMTSDEFFFLEDFNDIFEFGGEIYEFDDHIESKDGGSMVNVYAYIAVGESRENFLIEKML